MNHDYEGVPGRNTEHRSRRNPKMTGMAGGSADRERLYRERESLERQERMPARQSRRELDVMGDATVRPLKPSGQPGAGGNRMASGQNGTARPRFSPEQSGTGSARTAPRQTAYQTGSHQTAAHQAAARQTAAGKGPESGNSGWQQTLAARKKKKRNRIIAMIVAECFALVFIFGYGYVARQLNKIQRPSDVKLEQIKANNDLNVETVERMKGYWTIAVFGVDARDNAITKDTNADVNIICNINRDTGEIKLVSVFRDTYLNISEKGTYNKINQAYFLGGPEQAMQAMNKNLDLDISDYMTFNWKAVADAINVLGGVDIELSKAEFYYINSFITETVKATGVGSHQLTHAGMNHLDGVQAVAYGRLRLMDTDFARTERQRKIIAQAFEKAKKADFKTLNVLIGTVFPQVSTSIWVDDLVSNAKNISKFHLGETTGFPQARGDASMGKKGSVVVPQTLESNVIKLHEFLFGDENYTPSQTVKDISAKIAADTGMYKEGKYVDKVGTGGGVIQAPKPKKPAETEKAAKESDEDDIRESTKETGKNKTETDENGDPVKKTTAAETDENGDPIRETSEPETDEDGNPIESTSKKESSGTRPTAAETDENGDPLETTRYPRPGETETGTSARPTTPGTGKPGTTKESTEAVRPGESTGAGTGGTSSRPGTGTVPGSTSGTPGTTRPGAGTGNGAVDRPGGSSGTGNNGTTSVPGGNPGNSGTSSAPGGNTGNGSSGPAPGSPRPGGGESFIPAPPSVNGGPGSAGGNTGNNPGGGVVAGPGY